MRIRLRARHARRRHARRHAARGGERYRVARRARNECDVTRTDSDAATARFHDEARRRVDAAYAMMRSANMMTRLMLPRTVTARNIFDDMPPSPFTLAALVHSTELNEPC